jgi:putative FmdB family regulatory protein
MPIYEYRCTNGHTFETFQSMTDDPVSTCEVCGQPVERLFSPVAVHYKGSGFYTTDYARKGSASTSGTDDAGATASDSKGDSGSSGGDKSSSGGDKSGSGSGSASSSSTA